jgi:tRNA pseudouridine55 synthase
MEGILNIDKPGGMTSHDVVNRVRRVAGTRRVGHAGTLDPLATGVLVVCVGRATRLAEYVVGRPKSYETVVRLGETTNTYDADGEIEQTRPVVVTDEMLHTTLTSFQGVIEQVPPMYSAIKRDGQPLYKLARQGITVERSARTVTVTALQVLARDGDDVTLRVECSTGTYIRSLAHDLGEALGCGGHVLTLRRTRVGSFSAETAIPLDQLTSANIRDSLLPPERAVAYLPRIILNPQQLIDVVHGKPIAPPMANIESDLVYATDAAGHFVGVLRVEDDYLQPHKVFYQLPQSEA